MTQRKIIHLDMDAFFASVEQRDNPAYRGKPLIVGGDPNGRGVVAAASYEARAFGVRSAISCYEAKKRCPDAIFVRPRFEVYRAVSQEIRAIMGELTELVEPLSLDEAYLDVTGKTAHQGSATLMANWLRTAIYERTGLTASAGVSFNKMLAKIASDINKPNGIAIITPAQAQDFIAALPIERFHGIGKASAKRLHDIGVTTGDELRKLPLATLVDLFGQKRGQFYHQIAHGIDDRAVKAERVRKSIGTEITFSENSLNDDFILGKIYEQAFEAFGEMSAKELCATTVTLKIKYANFNQITRSHTVKTPFKNANAAALWLKELYAHTDKHLPVRLVGVTFSHLSPASVAYRQLDLFEWENKSA
ncbi:DNA polymerase IV [Moraxella caviae]|uniref:DNA polymerase IV n=1 Tax=Moraxella caviae TaxID=34060 RepID=A0A1S9ZVT9_9GAMM|nr:DNA polymerase IV [Moraxella caviae]OOR87646.1 DNA polymerase IV [Moraxella caviae]STZ10105.1 DNA polymerase IV [Moraxella caviae]